MKSILIFFAWEIFVLESISAFTLEPLHSDNRALMLSGAENASIEEFPYLVALELKSSQICGASILSANYVITAAHCFFNNSFSPNSYQVRAGSSIKEQGGTVHRVSNYSIHESFIYGLYNSSIGHDLAVLTLEKPIVFDDTKQPISMIEPDQEIKSGEVATIAGWGRLTYEGPKVQHLQSLQYNIIDKMSCLESYNKTGGIHEGDICAGTYDKSICNGDSGGPLVIDGKLAGVTSFASRCWSKPYPNVFTGIAYHREWIQSQMSKVNEVSTDIEVNYRLKISDEAVEAKI